MSGANEVEGRTRRRVMWSLVGGAVAIAVAVVWGIAASSSNTPTGSTPPPTLETTPPGVGSSTPSAPASTTTPATDAPPNAPPDTGLRETLAPTDLDAPAVPAMGLTVSLVSIESVRGEATIAGEVAGPALRVTVGVENAASEPLETPAVVVNLSYGADRMPAGPLIRPGGKQFPASIPAGGSAQGIYVFSVPLDLRDDLLIEVDLVVEEAIVLFEGSLD